jgi:putative membrane protein
MGTADAIPGVSGGTIALILGIYDRFIGSLAAVVAVLRNPFDAARWRTARRALLFLVPLGAGLGTAYLVATRLLVGKVPSPTNALEAAALRAEPPPGWIVNPATAPLVFAFFFGLVLASVNEPWKTKKTHRGVDWLLAAAGAAGAVALSLSPPAAGSLSPFALVGAGAVAVSVMLLPGVSGSLALLVLGMYQPISGAVHSMYDSETGTWHPQEIGVITWVLVGIALGVSAFVPLLRWVLARAHDRTMSVLSGLMLGSLAALWPWKAHYLPKTIPWEGAMSPELPGDGWWGPLLSALAGAAIIVTMSRVAARRAGVQAR